MGRDLGKGSNRYVPGPPIFLKNGQRRCDCFALTVNILYNSTMSAKLCIRQTLKGILE